MREIEGFLMVSKILFTDISKINPGMYKKDNSSRTVYSRNLELVNVRKSIVIQQRKRLKRHTFNNIIPIDE